ncbi:MAG: polysaccharide biosynthesis protein [Mucilaginibacter sp.]|nr:polysaccharide biosynthesis protein [Mucilaginibacter sp.]
MIHAFLGKRAFSKWLIFLIDQVIVCWSLTFSLFIVMNFRFTEILRGYFFVYFGIYMLLTTIVFIRMRIPNGIIRYSNIEDIYRIFLALLLTSIVYWIIIESVVTPYFHAEWRRFDLAVILNFFISSSLLIVLRIYVKYFYAVFKINPEKQKEAILIYGSSEVSILIKEAIEAQQEKKFEILGFIDDDKNRAGKCIQQKKVYHSSYLPLLKDKHKACILLITNDFINENVTQKLFQQCIDVGIKVSVLPPSDQWLYGKLSLSQLRELNINDLLQREPIILQKNNILKEVTGKRVLVTGAAGSIGSEIVRQLINYNPETIILCDQAESPLHDLQLELCDNFNKTDVVMFMANVQSRKRMLTLFNLYKPQIVFHAAAYKHVPMMENNPIEAVMTNIFGTKNLADLADEFGVEKFIMISTDKAVNPTNVMGASKRIAEIYIQSLNDKPDYLKGLVSKSKTCFITTRFGNVLGSNGSVIPRFKHQIDHGGPITVTHPEITRYFMTIPEAVELVLEAAAMGEGCEIFVFDMGKPIKIVDLAINMIKLAGLEPDKDIKITYTGLRPGEKLYEELLNKEECTIPTHHEKIKIAKIRTYPFLFVQQAIEDLWALKEQGDDYELVRTMKTIIPEFRSNNSVFEKLDDCVKEKVT